MGYPSSTDTAPPGSDIVPVTGFGPTPEETAGILGYDPWAIGDNGLGPKTPSEWAYDFALTYSNRWANGNLGDTGAGTIWDASYWGGALPSPEIRGSSAGSGIIGAADFNTFYQEGLYLAENWNSLPDSVKSTLPMPPSAAVEIGLSPDERERLFIASENEKDRAVDRARIAASERSAAAGAAATVTAAGIRAAADIAVANIRAAVDREAIAVQREANQIRREEEAGRNRRFDLQLSEDRRQFNERLAFDRDVLEQQKREFRTGVVIDLLDRGIELSRRPVDWVAHQFFMANLGAPLSMAGLLSSAAVYGAVPPTGPSAAGPVVGGPGAMDGDTALAESIGVQAGFVPVSQAAQQFPSGGAWQAAAEYNAQNSVQRTADALTNGDVQALDQTVAETRATEVAPTVQQNPVMDAAVTEATTGQPQPAGVAPPASPAPAQPPQIPGAETPQPDVTVATVTPAAPATVAGPTPSTAENTGESRNSGVFVGEPAQAQPTAGAFGSVVAGTGAQNPQGEAMLQLIANETGIDINTLRSVLPPELLAGGYSKETIENSPVIQAIRNGTLLSETRQAPVTPGGIATIGAFGIPLGIRSGQDVFAPSILKAGDVNRGLIQGAIEGAGLDFRDTVRQSLLSSPVTTIPTGAFGRRVFG